MKKVRLIVFFIGICNFIYSQQQKVVDSLYLEDQLYLSTSYTFFADRPEGMRQSGFSGEFSGGFIKDIPLNKRRNVALGIGIGYAYNVYNSSLKITEEDFSIAADYNKNRLHTHLLEFPIEVRWRNSNPTRYSFFRIYGGMKFSYVLHSKSNYEDNTMNISYKTISEIQKFQYGLHFVIGYGIWNLYTYYALQPMFKGVTISNQELNVSRLTVGIKFYIL